TGTFLGAKYAAPQMIKQKKGKIINIASISGLNGYVYPSYAASKAGIVNLTRGLAWELGPHGINVNCICPGLVHTNLNQSLLDNQTLYQKVIEKIPQRRLGLPQEVADTAIFLACDRSDYFNGAALPLDGGCISYFNFFE
ncbi:MAG: SDR family oxidoreductase, partial [Firmicutes bacterium]|nr:SDR family oxidoreductase [Bacillota bacterium]